MKLEQQVASLELSKRLKELGVKQESALYAWIRCLPKSQVKWQDHNLLETHEEYFVSANVKEWSWAVWQCTAFTVAELGVMLPITIRGEWFYSTREPDTNQFRCWYGMLDISYDCPVWHFEVEPCYADTEADARAKMLVYLLENKIIESPK